MLSPIKIKIINKNKNFQTIKVPPLRIYLFDLDVIYAYIQTILTAFKANVRAYVKLFITSAHPGKQVVGSKNYIQALLKLFGNTTIKLYDKHFVSGHIKYYARLSSAIAINTVAVGITQTVSKCSAATITKCVAEAVIVGVRYLRGWCGADNKQTMGVTFGEFETLNTLCYINS